MTPPPLPLHTGGPYLLSKCPKIVAACGGQNKDIYTLKYGVADENVAFQCLWNTFSFDQNFPRVYRRQGIQTRTPDPDRILLIVSKIL